MSVIALLHSRALFVWFALQGLPVRRMVQLKKLLPIITLCISQLAFSKDYGFAFERLDALKWVGLSGTDLKTTSRLGAKPQSLEKASREI